MIGTYDHANKIGGHLGSYLVGKRLEGKAILVQPLGVIPFPNGNNVGSKSIEDIHLATCPLHRDISIIGRVGRSESHILCQKVCGSGQVLYIDAPKKLVFVRQSQLLLIMGKGQMIRKESQICLADPLKIGI